MFALGTMVSFARNTDKCVGVTSCEEQIKRYFEITIDEWYYPGDGCFQLLTIFIQKRDGSPQQN